MFKLQEELKPVELSEQDDSLLKEAKQLLLTESVEEMNLLDSWKLKSTIVTKRDNLQRLTRLESLEKDYGKIYTLKEIEKVALEYNLRFLNIGLYNKEVPAYLATKLVEFRKLHERKAYFAGYSVSDTLKSKTFILAPSNHFHLLDNKTVLFDLSIKHVQDPAAFVQVDKDAYVLIHSWGDDLNAFNLLAGHFNKTENRAFIKNLLLYGCFVGILLAGLFQTLVASLIVTFLISAVISFFITIRHYYNTEKCIEDDGVPYWCARYRSTRSFIAKFPWD